MNIFEKFVIALISVLAIFVLWLFFAILPVLLVNEPLCFESGYERAKITINLDVYCVKNNEMGATVITSVGDL